MNKKKLSLFIVLVLTITKFYGQSSRPDSLHISYEKNGTKDTVWLTVNTGINAKPGSLMLVASNDAFNITDTFFFPVIDRVSVYTLVVPAAYQSGSLQLTAYFYPKIFSVAGKVVNPIKDEQLNVLLITERQRIYNKPVNLTEEKNFSLPGLVFENKATLIFNYVEKSKKHPNIVIQQTPAINSFTDSVFAATIVLSNDTMPVAVTPNAPVSFIPPVNNTDKKVKTLDNVTVTGQRMSKSEKFNETYSSGLFKDPGEKVVDCLDNDQILAFPDCISFLQAKVPGLRVTIDRFGESSVIWRNKETKAFFIDEIPVDLDQLLILNVDEIAIIKVFPPPFTGAQGTGDGGGISVYTRRGEFRRPDANESKWLFEIKGYSPNTRTLFSPK